MKKYIKLFILLALFLLWSKGSAQRIGNYIANGSFEDLYDCSSISLLKAKYWTGIDSLCAGGNLLSVCNGSVPASNATYQYPHSGHAFLWSIFYYSVNTNAQRTYSKNRLKSKLQTGKTYCVKFYVNITNRSTDGIDGFGAFFGDNSIDTIKYCNIPLSYFTPQVQNPNGNIISDTLNWVAITGTFTANGTEKFLLLGNFLANNAVNTASINPYNIAKWTEVAIDDISCIEVDLPAYAGRDTTIYMGDSTYVGREKDFAIDTGCVWYCLPNTFISIDTISGIWVKPNAPGTYTYIVKQHLECSGPKSDTVVVTVRNSDVGISENRMNIWQIDMYPNPVEDKLIIKNTGEKDNLIICIFDLTGRLILSGQFISENFTCTLNLDLTNGAYLVRITNVQGQTFTKKLLIAK